VRLGERDRALEILRFLVADQRPPEWNGWPEISWIDKQTPKFIGDMPHSWIGSHFIRSVRDMLAYEREEDRSLVIAAGVPPEWVSEEPGVSVKRLPTHFGILSYSMRLDGPNTLRVRLTGDLNVPPGGIEIHSPIAGPIHSASVDGAPVLANGANTVTVRQFPAEVAIELGTGQLQAQAPAEELRHKGIGLEGAVGGQ
jgi:hypothetical protein